MKGRWIIWAGLLVAAVGASVLGRGPSTPVPVIWQVSIPWLKGDAIAASTNDTVYVGTFAGEVIAIDHNGRKLWTSPPGVRAGPPPVVGDDGTIYFRATLARPQPSKPGTATLRDAIFALRPDGSVKWRRGLDGILNEPTGFAFAIGRDGALLFGTTNNEIGAVGSDGEEKWRLPVGALVGAPVTSASGSIFFSGGPGLYGGAQTLFCVDSNSHARFSTPGIQEGRSRLAVDWDETVYLPGGSNKTMRAVKADGATIWTCATPFRACSEPTIGNDGSLYFTTMPMGGTWKLCAVSHEGKLKWELPLGRYWNFKPPVVASDGTLFVVSSDPKVTAVNPDGTVKWVFRPPRHPLVVNRLLYWNDFKDLWRKLFSETPNSFVTPPVLTSKGILYVGFGGPYNTLYALNAGVGPATNSPWPMEGANAQRTRRLVHRPE